MEQKKNAGGKQRNSSRKNNQKQWKPTRRTEQPRRGGPGIILTCEAGREFKCRREGLEILSYYYQREQKSHHNSDEKGAEQQPLSLEDEIKSLQQQGKRASDGPFAEYHTACKGTIVLMFTPPRSGTSMTEGSRDSSKEIQANIDSKDKNTIEATSSPPKPTADDKKRSAAANDTKPDSEDNTEGPKTKKLRTEQQNIISSPDICTWDSVATIRQVIGDINSSNNSAPSATEAPSSRFVVRMIPMQITCFASLEALIPTLAELVERSQLLSDKKKKSFAVALKRRLCHDKNMKRNVVITAIVEKLLTLDTHKLLSVDLSHPDYMIQVEVVGNLCGISIFSNPDFFHNFNILELRRSNQGQDDEIDNDAVET